MKENLSLPPLKSVSWSFFLREEGSYNENINKTKEWQGEEGTVRGGGDWEKKEKKMGIG